MQVQRNEWGVEAWKRLKYSLSLFKLRRWKQLFKILISFHANFCLSRTEVPPSFAWSSQTKRSWTDLAKWLTFFSSFCTFQCMASVLVELVAKDWLNSVSNLRLASAISSSTSLIIWSICCRLRTWLRMFLLNSNIGFLTILQQKFTMYDYTYFLNSGYQFMIGIIFSFLNPQASMWWRALQQNSARRPVMFS